jgi:hypothetical protein
VLFPDKLFDGKFMFLFIFNIKSNQLLYHHPVVGGSSPIVAILIFNMEQHDIPVDCNCILTLTVSIKDNYSNTVNRSNKRIKTEIRIKHLYVFNFKQAPTWLQSALIIFKSIRILKEYFRSCIIQPLNIFIITNLRIRYVFFLTTGFWKSYKYVFS